MSQIETATDTPSATPATPPTSTAMSALTSFETRMAVERIVSYIARTPALGASTPDEAEARRRAIAKASGYLMGGNWQRAIVAVAQPLPPASSGMEARMRMAETYPEDAAPPVRRVFRRAKRKGHKGPSLAAAA